MSGVVSVKRVTFFGGFEGDQRKNMDIFNLYF